MRLFLPAVAIGLALAASACRKPDEGATKVIVIGETPKLTDPATSALSSGDAVLLANVAQGLVRFDPRGEIEPGLAETWNVSDDGLSYIFRLANTEWQPSGQRVTSHQVARILRRAISGNSRNRIRDTLGAVDEVVAMTDRVIEIRLRAPRPNLLQLLAQPEFALMRNGDGTGPFEIAKRRGANGALRLVRMVPVPDEEEEQRDEVELSGAKAEDAVHRFAAGDIDVVLGGRIADLPFVRTVQLQRTALRFDPVAGLFGLVPGRAGGALAEREVRQLLVQAIDRDALVAALNVPGLSPRATLLEGRLEGVPDPVAPTWTATPIVERRAALLAEANRLFGKDKPTLTIALPEGPGGDILLARLGADWVPLGIGVERVGPNRAADLRLIDEVAPSTSPAWFLRQFRCGQVPVCVAEADELLAAAREAPVANQRGALLVEAARLMDEAQLFLPLAAPIRWSLVSDRAPGFAGNRFAIHTLTSLKAKLDRERAD